MKFTLDKILFLTFFIAVLVIFLFEFAYFDSPELFKGGGRLSKLGVNVSLSYIAAYLFYIFTIYLPKIREKKLLSEHLAYLIILILASISRIIERATDFNISQKDIKLKNLTNKDFQQAMKGIYFTTTGKGAYIEPDGEIRNRSVGIDVKYGIEDLQGHCNELLKFILYLDPHLVSLVTQALRSQFNSIWVNSIEHDVIKFNGKPLRSESRDITNFSTSLVTYHELYTQIEKILKTDFSHTKASKDHFSFIDKIENKC